METAKLKKFAQSARRRLLEQVSGKLEQVLIKDSAARRENAEAVKKLEEAIQEHSKEQIIERVAYIWFNRFCALRFMDVNHYTRIGVVSPTEGQTQPEILAEAKMGHIDETMVRDDVRQYVTDLLSGKAPSRDPQGEAYRLLVVAVCNYLNAAMPFLFQRIDDYTELLMPDNLLSDNSILANTREAMTRDACEDVEVIGWLYQFYISEKKDEVFDGLKKNKKITPENIPAATQLFTPHWIVRYLVENSLGRLWLLNRPNSKLAEQMDYYIKPEQAEDDFLRITKPEEIKICDPACGSGHMLTYAFDLLYAIYEEEGYDARDIPEKILTHNLYGIEIDERAGELAAFALTMKARAKQRRFFTKKIKPNICVLENVHFADNELDAYMEFVGRDLLTLPLRKTLSQFEEADNFGALIRPQVTEVNEALNMLRAKDISGQLFLSNTHKKVLQVLHQVDYLSPKYHVVVANPPYMGGKGMNPRLAKWLKDHYQDMKSDLFAAFVVRNSELALAKGQLGFMTPFVWMFISSYEKLRHFIIDKKTITSLIQLEYSGFDGATVPICTFTLENAHREEYKGGYVRLSDFRGAENQAPRALEAIQNTDCGWFYRASAADFKKIPGSPVVYWIHSNAFISFENTISLSQRYMPRQGLTTTDNNKFVRNWFEVPIRKIGFGMETCEMALESKMKWFPMDKGGGFRKWYGNNTSIVNWECNGEDIKNTIVLKYPYLNGNPEFVAKNTFYYFKPGVTWGKITSSNFSCRYTDSGFIFSDAGSKVPTDNRIDTLKVTQYLNSKVCSFFLSLLSQTLNFEQGTISKLPFKEEIKNLNIIEALIKLSSKDWDAYEASWDFTALPLLNPEYRQDTLQETYNTLRQHWHEMTQEMLRLEEENNRIFIDAYGLQDELTPDVPLNEITLTCNPHYRYGGNKTDEELEALLLADTIRELISYAVGCMFGRYSLDQPGLILANQGESIEDYLAQNAEPSFMPDKDNVIPILDNDWFTDDIVERFRQFLRTTFGEEHYVDNLAFIENALGKDIRKYFQKDFYNDHVKRYKKRPIYWLFSSPKGNFNALIYMHRYQPDTVSVVLNNYLREFHSKLISHKRHLEAVSINTNSSKSEKTKALKEIEKISKVITEMEEYEHEVLYPLATEQVAIDLDDGVKVNYPKFGTALKKIVGLEAKED
ncbi:BREX-1 system adenine-specific DNA-methyltransferase PglX [Cardiobacteriaceae bacterium TAE3-ERU3]|nr:BREX-1 system adenine-specific DNA-methyltransferase PglX [Cardiobacteriaceae bacterium TAE3-ERU3]